MKKTKFKLLFLSVTILTSFNAFAINEYVRHYRGVRSVGMGGSLFTTGVYEEALFGNPAMHTQAHTWKVSIINVTGEVNSNMVDDVSKFSKVSSAGGSDIFSKVADAGIVGRNEHVRISNVTGFYLPKFFSDNTAFAFGILVNSQTNVLMHNTIELDIMSINDFGPAFGVARKFMDGNLSIGVNVRGIYRIGADKLFKASDFLGGKKLSVKDIGGQGMGLDGDIGGYYKFPWEFSFMKVSAGATIQNVAASNYDFAFKTLIKSIPPDARPPANERNLNLGARVDFSDFVILHENKVALEVHQIGPSKKRMTVWKRVHMGGETKLFNLLFVRGGFNQGYYTAGLGILLPLLKFEVATYGEEIGTNAGMLEDRRYLARIALEI